MIEITPALSISEDEIRFAFSRSGGPGGQHVNKVSTRVTLLFDLEASPSLTPEQKDRLRGRLGTRISKEGVLRVVSGADRSQARNRRTAVERFAALVARALEERRPRRKTRLPRAAAERRLEEKRRRARLKRARAGGEEGA